MRRLFHIIILVFLANSGFSRELWIVQANAVGYRVGPSSLRWRSDVFFHNQGPVSAEVRLLKVSNEMPGFSRQDRFSIDPGRTTGLEREMAETWDPRLPTPLWVVHVDVPETVIVEGTLQIGSELVTGPPNFAFEFGRVSMPVWDRLTPSNVPKTHVGADLGDIKGHVNVGVFNASATADAETTIEIRRVCDDALIATHSFVVPPNTIQQFGNLVEVPLGFCTGGPGPFMYPTAYVVVTTNQPSLSYVAVVSNQGLPTVNSSINSKP